MINVKSLKIILSLSAINIPPRILMGSEIESWFLIMWSAPVIKNTVANIQMVLLNFEVLRKIAIVSANNNRISGYRTVIRSLSQFIFVIIVPF